LAREQRRLAAIVSADVAGYSRMMGQDESGTLAAFTTIRRDLVDPKIAAHGGRIVKTTGDGLLLEFASVVDAVRCVIEIQTALATSTIEVAGVGRIAFRFGVNQGDIIGVDDDIFGDGVNVAARLQEKADPGGLCISGESISHVVLSVGGKRTWLLHILHSILLFACWYNPGAPGTSALSMERISVPSSIC